MLKAMRLVLALALLFSATSATAGTAIVNQVGKDFGGYWDIGTLGSLGSQLKDTGGKAIGAWVRTHDTTVTPLVLTWFGITDMPNIYNAFMLNTYWNGVDYAANAGYVMFFIDGTNGNGWGKYWNAAATVAFNDGNYHHHMVTFSGLSSGIPTSFNYYVDGVSIPSPTDFSDAGGLSGTVSNFTKNIYIGCDGKTNSNTPIDMSTLDVEDLRIYTRTLSADEVNQIYKMKGRDMIRRGLLSRYMFWTGGTDKGSNQYTAVKHNNAGGSSDPTIETTKKCSGQRRKVM
jgi:hypothetical protein